MYFSGWNGDVYNDDTYMIGQNLYYAESEDGFHYTFKGKIMDGVVEQSVFLTGEKDKPYGLVGRASETGRLCVFLWKSEDGIEFGDKTLLLIPRMRWSLVTEGSNSTPVSGVTAGSTGRMRLRNIPLTVSA